MARWTAVRCLNRSGCTRTWDDRMLLRATLLRRCWHGSGRRCLNGSRLASMTTSSMWADTPCWRFGSSPVCAIPSSWSCACITSSTIPLLPCCLRPSRSIRPVALTFTKGSDVMLETERLSEAKRALLEKYLQGSVPHTATAAGAINRRTQAKPASSVLPDSPVPLVPVQTGGSKRPLFYVHVHWIGGAFYCFAIA